MNALAHSDMLICHMKVKVKLRVLAPSAGIVGVAKRYSKSPHIRTYQNKNLEAVFLNNVKNLFQYDGTWVLIAGVAKLIVDCCY